MPFLEKRIYLHLLRFNESLLIFSHFTTRLSSSFAVFINLDGESPFSKKLLSSANILDTNLEETDARSFI